MLAAGAALLLMSVPADPAPGSVAATPPASGERSVRLTPLALLDWAASNEGSHPDLAERAYQALAGDSDVRIRSEARYRLAGISARRGRLTEAAVLLRHVLDEQPDAQRVRLELASLQERLGDEEGARRTLRAASAGQLPKAVARLVSRWSEALRSRRPAGFSVELAIAPDSNINRATRSDTLSTVVGDFTIAPDSQARSGLGVAAGASTFRRFSLGGDLAVVGRLTGAGRFYRDRRFTQLDVEASLGLEAALGKSRLLLEGGAGQGWVGGDIFARQVRATAALRRPLGPRMVVGTRLTGLAIDNRFNALADGRALLGELSVERALSSRSGLLVTLAGERFHARDAAYRTTRWEAGVTGWQDLGRFTLFGGVALGRLRGDEPLALFTEARKDRLVRVSIGGSTREIRMLGLVPFLRIVRESNASNTAFYHYARTRSEIGFSRAY
ncbi:hypothetical protein GGQ97_000981 [Sphingomonas kaistensis]|uniref:Surface lipoprotein assembly modifier C-terminal domain-containing protein n=1 Tax=Sphingomonas kaistensis TaxID=298708 RepID=A0A7X5Y4S1_9SPHN|nr:porin family protein [Sphingomonas kaistensis]NJC05188.1 hypothetical protein [Sphingomonas kaistensis]